MHSLFMNTRKQFALSVLLLSFIPIFLGAQEQRPSDNLALTPGNVSPKGIENMVETSFRYYLP